MPLALMLWIRSETMWVTASGSLLCVPLFSSTTLKTGLLKLKSVEEKKIKILSFAIAIFNPLLELGFARVDG